MDQTANGRACGLASLVLSGGFSTFWILPSPTRISAGLAVAAVMALSVMVAGSMKVHGEDRVPALTGIDRSDDVIQAHQLLMDGIESEMMVIELAVGGQGSAT